MTAAAAGGLLTAATAGAQTGEPIPQPQRPGHRGTDPGPRNLARDRQNPDLLVPPSNDHGTLPNLRFSFSDSHVRQESGGWTRQVTVRTRSRASTRMAASSCWSLTTANSTKTTPSC
jgi:oxalate decarboxylase